MFQKKYRLLATPRLLHPQNIYTSYFIIKIANNNLNYNRYGFIVSKKIDKRAVARNRLKRRFRACLEILQNDLVGGHDFLFFLKKEAKDESTNSLYHALQKVLLKKDFGEMKK